MQVGDWLGQLLHEVAVDSYFYVAFSPDGRIVASKNDKDEIRVLQVADGATVCRFKPPPDGTSPLLPSRQTARR